MPVTTHLGQPLSEVVWYHPPMITTAPLSPEAPLYSRYSNLVWVGYDFYGYCLDWIPPGTQRLKIGVCHELKEIRLTGLRLEEFWIGICPKLQFIELGWDADVAPARFELYIHDGLPQLTANNIRLLNPCSHFPQTKFSLP